MKKIIVLIFLLFIFASKTFSQSNKEISFLLEGKCYKVLNHLVKQTKNDSLAVSYFLENYIILDNPIRDIKHKSYKYIFEVFSNKSNKDNFCISKPEYYNKSLLIKSEPK
ncbi:MAG: hypothetical protein COB60_03560 [Flavobacteriaceae bacterium]|nr:MAG: hypothetical protein COB60_03560 [Flavobacteriaceae bacterium]